MRIFIIRHAETDSNVNKVIQGTLDTDINETGHHQARLLAKAYKNIRPAHIYCSDLKRCRQTLAHLAGAISEESGSCVDVTYTPLLRERYMAELQGVSKEEVEQMCRESGKDKFDYGEAPLDLTARVTKFWMNHVVPNTNDGDIVVCSHGGTLLSLMKALTTTFEYHGFIGGRASGNTGVTILDTEEMEVLQYADVNHLSQEDKAEAEMENVDV